MFARNFAKASIVSVALMVSSSALADLGTGSKSGPAPQKVSSSQKLEGAKTLVRQWSSEPTGKESKPGVCGTPDRAPKFHYGDLNCDGVVDFSDADAIALAIADPTTWSKLHPDCDIMAADLNRDGYVDNSDIDQFAATMAAVVNPRADVNGDGRVTQSDIDALVIALLDMGTFSTLYPGGEFRADINGDGVVDNSDIQSLLEALGG